MFVLHLNNFILDLHSKYYSMDVIIFPTNINSSQYIGIRTQDYDLNLINRIKTVPKAYWNPNKNRGSYPILLMHGPNANYYCKTINYTSLKMTFQLRKQKKRKLILAQNFRKNIINSIHSCMCSGIVSIL
jgi:hypothetical protein